MKKTLPFRLAVACIAVASQLISCNYYVPVRTDEPRLHQSYDTTRYRPHEVIVMFKDTPTTADITKIKGAIHEWGIDSATIKIRKCNSCNGYMELWSAPNIHLTIHANGIGGGAKSPRDTNGVGEDGLAHYSLNFTQDIPMDFYPEKKYILFNYDSLKNLRNDTTNKEVVRIAVLDTGMDTEQIINASYHWTNPGERSIEANKVDEDKNCYTDDINGWNFIGQGDNNVMDDNPNRHGTMVSLYIIREFASSQKKAVKLMTLKTHDKNGRGDLFSSICAIHYAMEKGAQIINASWGFYYYQDDPHPYLENLITKVLREKGILFVAAAGNKIDQQDDFARDAYYAKHGIIIPDIYLRDIECHNFYPAYLSTEDNNVITVTTANNQRVSPTQNYSSKYVDLGAIPDDPTSMRFHVPFDDSGATISGSSFAAAIVTGRIGAFLPNSSYRNKRNMLVQMQTDGLCTKAPVLELEHIREGRITKHN